MSTLAPAAPFDPSGWLKMDGAEREELVRPHYADYLAVRAILKAEGRATDQIAYSADFVGQIPALSAAGRDAEDTGIYLLQKLHSLEEMRAQIEAFLEAGGRHLTVEEVKANPTGLRGTVARYGWYMGGTGWQVFENVRVRATEGRFPRLYALPKGRRTNGYDLSGGGVLFRPEGVAA